MNQLPLSQDFHARTRTIALDDMSHARKIPLSTEAAVLPSANEALGPATGVHPAAIGVALGASAYLLIAAWFAFHGGETSLMLAVITVLLVVLFGCLAGGGGLGRNVTPDRRQTRSFAEFLEGDVDIETGRISGREAFLQIAMLPMTLAIGGTAIIAIALWTA